jgi:hypothetical protein
MAKPAYRAYTVIKRENKDDYWLNLGVCFPHEDGEGFNLLLQALPLDGKSSSAPTRRTRKRSRRAKASPATRSRGHGRVRDRYS